MMYGGSKKKMMMYGGKKKKMQRGGQGGPFIEKPKDMDLPKKKMKDGGLKMVKDPKTGKMVPFYAADGKGKMKLGGTPEMKKLKAEQKEMRKGMRMARKEQRGQEREERLDRRAERRSERSNRRAVRKANRKMSAAERKLLAGKQAEAQGKLKKAARKQRKATKKGVQGAASRAMAKMYKSGGFLEMPVFDLDRD